MIRISALPHRKARRQTVREASLNQPHHALNRDALGRHDQMNMIRHHNERVKFIVTLTMIVLQRFEEEF